MLKILPYPHPFLRHCPAKVQAFDQSLATTVEHLFKLLYAVKGWGLAANQVGLDLKLAVIDISEEQNTPLCVVNPEIIHAEGQIASEEDCLSFPGTYVNIMRHKQIQVQYQDLMGASQVLNVSGMLSVCLQHEIDHLNGVLMIDYLSKLKRERLLKKFEKMQHRGQPCADHQCDHHH